MQDFVDTTLRLLRTSLLISAIQRVFRFFSGKLSYKTIENFFPEFAWPDINTRGVRGILPTPLVFISGYANTENVFYCLNETPIDSDCSVSLYSIFDDPKVKRLRK